MHKTITKVFRVPLRDRLSAFRRVDTYSEQSGFVDTYQIAKSDGLEVSLVVTASPTNDTFVISVSWQTSDRNALQTMTYQPVSICRGDGGVTYDLVGAPQSASINFGILVHGRPTTYHFLGKFAPDAKVPLDLLYSSGDGPNYRAERAKNVVDLIGRQIDDVLLPFVDALKAHFKGQVRAE